MFCDIHSHILPGIDDGVERTSRTGEVLRLLNKEGITHLAFTPHYYPSKNLLDRFLGAREYVAKKVLSLPESEGFTFSFGAEVYFTETLFNYNDIHRLCYNGTGLMLTELEYGDTFTSSMERRLCRLIEDYRITPVLAHIDRYAYLMRNPKLLIHLKEMGCLLQMNLLSFSVWYRRPSLFRITRMGLVDFIGEDIHSVPLVGAEREKLLKQIEKGDPLFIKNADYNAKKHIFLS
jgi:protein-tyrosine phosphatase